MPKQKLPAPRLQMRWTSAKKQTGFDDEWLCHYELVLPLEEQDIRAWQQGPRGGRRPHLKELVIPIGKPTSYRNNHVPCGSDGGIRFYDDPCMDGDCAKRHAAMLGNLPIFVIAPDGMAFKYKGTEQSGRA